MNYNTTDIIIVAAQGCQNNHENIKFLSKLKF